MPRCGSISRDGRRWSSTGFASKWSSTFWPHWPECESTTARCGSTRPKCPVATARRRRSSKRSMRPALSSNAAPVRQIAVGQSMRVGDEEQLDRSPTAAQCRPLDFVTNLDYGEQSAIGRQLFALDITPDSFRRELAPCRTFIPQEAAQGILAQGIGKRVSDAAIVDLRPERSDRQHAAISRRMRATQNVGRRWRPGSHRLRSDRSRRGPSQWTSPSTPNSPSGCWNNHESPNNVLKQRPSGVVLVHDNYELRIY